MYHTQYIGSKNAIINYLGKKYDLKSVLEISSTMTGHAHFGISTEIFPLKELLVYLPPNMVIKQSRLDTNITPLSYETGIATLQGQKFDIVFLDPWHTFEQSKQDMENALQLVNDNGFIVIHDCCPHSKNYIGKFSSGAWCDQTYEAFIDFKMKHPLLESIVVDVDYGCAVIKMNGARNVAYQLPNPEMTLHEVSEWDYFYPHRIELLDLITGWEFSKRY